MHFFKICVPIQWNIMKLNMNIILSHKIVEVISKGNIHFFFGDFGEAATRECVAQSKPSPLPVLAFALRSEPKDRLTILYR